MANTDGKRRATKNRKQGDEAPFDPATALERLHTATVRLEAVSRAVVSSTEFLSVAEDIDGRRALEQSCALMIVLDKEIAETVRMGDAMVERLKRYLKDH